MVDEARSRPMNEEAEMLGGNSAGRGGTAKTLVRIGVRKGDGKVAEGGG